MYRPPQRIKYKPVPGRSPSAAEAEASLLFSPITYQNLHLDQRTWVPAMVPWRASEDGFVTDDILDWYERMALGRPGALVVEATGIRDIPSGPLLRIGHDRYLPGLRDLVDVVGKASDGQTRLFIQLIDFLSIRRRPEREKFLGRYLEITSSHRQRLEADDLDDETIRQKLLACTDDELSAILTEREFESLAYGYRERVTDTHLPHIRDLPSVLPGLFAAAAGRAQQSGMDGVELHYAHAYTMASFLSARNNRDDGYGGTRENRVRLPLEVYQQVRDVVGNDYTVGCRFLSDDCIEGGSDVDDAKFFGTEFARAGMDFLSVSRGGKFEDAAQPRIGWSAYPYTGSSGYECMPSYISDEQGPFGRNFEPTAAIRTAVRQAGFETPVVVAGGVHGFEQAEALLSEGRADIVAAARQSLADPDWFVKLQLGRGDEVKVCEYTNSCEGLDQKHKQVTCKLWDRVGRDEPGVKLSNDGKRRLTAPYWDKKA
jgi:2,4-dienoyl-CoA reductase-like NADH-dependent reductase (Old Yellow Enzyme family)